MAMNVKPVPTLDDEVNEIRLATAEIVNVDILPNEDKLWGWLADSANATNEVKEEAKELKNEIQNKVKKAKLWAPHLPSEFGGMGLSFMQHAFMNDSRPDVYDAVRAGEAWSDLLLFLRAEMA